MWFVWNKPLFDLSPKERKKEPSSWAKKEKHKRACRMQQACVCDDKALWDAQIML